MQNISVKFSCSVPKVWAIEGHSHDHSRTTEEDNQWKSVHKWKKEQELEAYKSVFECKNSGCSRFEHMILPLADAVWNPIVFAGQ